jgi:YD repeat-containing protein
LLGAKTEQAFTLLVSTTANVAGIGNQAPEITSLPKSGARPGLAYSYQAVASDPENDVITWRLLKGPTGMTLSASGLVSWPSAITGEQFFAIEARDPSGGRAVQTVSIFVSELASDRNVQPPRMSAPPPLTAITGQLYVATIASDARYDFDAVTMQLVEGPSNAQMILQNGRYRVEFTPTTDGEVPIAIVLRDAYGAETKHRWIVRVSPNRAPVFANLGQPSGTGLSTVPYSGRFLASDPDGDVIRFALTAAPDGMTIDANTGDVQWPTPVDGLVQVGVMATDSFGYSTSYTRTIQFRSTNGAPRFNSAPIVSGMTSSRYSYFMSASDPDNDTLSYRLISGPTGMTLQNTVFLDWTPTRQQVGVFPVVIEVNDPFGGFARQEFTITVTLSNNSPPIFATTPVVNATAAQTYQAPVTGTDAENNYPLEVNVLSGPTGLVFTRSGIVGGILTWPVPAGATGSFPVSIELKDSLGAAARQDYSITIGTGGNRPPVITSNAPTQAVINQPYRYTVLANDPDSDPLSYVLTASPTGMTISATGEINFTPSAAQLGTHEVVLQVSDGRGASALQSYTLGVSPLANNAPVITSAAITTGFDLRTYQYQVIATDADSNLLSFSLTQAPSGMVISPAGLIEWSKPVIGQYQVTVRVADEFGASITQSYQLAITAVNLPPVIRSLPLVVTAVGLPYEYPVIATDPNNNSLTYSIQSVASGAVIDANSGVLRWGAPTAGVYDITVTVSDGQLSTTQDYRLNVRRQSQAISLGLSVDRESADIGQPIILTYTHVGGEEPVYVYLTCTGQAGAVPTTNNQAIRTRSFASTEDCTITATDRENVTHSVTKQLRWKNPGDTTAPVALITSPIIDQEVTAPIDVLGTATDANFAEYLLEARNSTGSEWQLLSRRTNPVNAASLGKLDPSALENGYYDLRLTVIDTSNNRTEAFTRVEVEGQMKLGNLRISFSDMQIEAARIPIEVIRSYDSFRRNEKLAMGHGWSVTSQVGKVRKNLATGLDWEIYREGSFSNCVRTRSGNRKVSIDLGDGKLYRFVAKLRNNCFGVTQLPPYIVEVDFEPMARTNTASLVAAGPPMLFAQAGTLLDTGSGEAWDPQRFILTMEDGTKVLIDQSQGVRKIEDRTGATLDFANNGILSSNGESVLFERDSQNRITAIIDPMGQRVEYRYDANGDLREVKDRTGAISYMRYRAGHLLYDYTDPRGRVLSKYEYDAAGRLTSQFDADSRQINLTHNTEARTEVVTDRLNRSTAYKFDDRGNVVEVKNALNEVNTMTYDARDNELTSTDALGRTTTRTFSANDKVLTETNPAGEVTQSKYNTYGEQTESKDALGRITRTAFGNAGPASVTNPANRSELGIRRR